MDREAILAIEQFKEQGKTFGMWNVRAENFRAFLSGFLPAINDITVLSHVCEDDFVVTHWEVDAVFGIIPILEKFRIAGGKITEAFGFFDPRPILGN